MKRIIAILLSFAPLFAFAQEHQIIGGYLLDGEDSFEELDAAVVTDAKRRDKNLDGKGMRFPGGAMMMIPESVGKEIGSIVEVKNPFLVKRQRCPDVRNELHYAEKPGNRYALVFYRHAFQ